MPLPIPKPPGPNGNPPPYDAMKDLAERCARAEKERDALRGQLDAMAAVVKSAYVDKDEVRKLVECLEWVHMGSICGDPATSAASRKDCPICQALNHAKSLGL